MRPAELRVGQRFSSERIPGHTYTVSGKVKVIVGVVQVPVVELNGKPMTFMLCEELTIVETNARPHRWRRKAA